MERTPVELERWRRIRAALCAYAYEYEADSLISDAEFDRLCAEIDVSVSTGHRELDIWFKREFDKCTGQWIHRHPHKARIKQLYEVIKASGQPLKTTIHQREG